MSDSQTSWSATAREIMSLLDGGTTAKELDALRTKLTTLTEISAAQESFFAESRSCLQREVEELRRTVEASANSHTDAIIQLQGGHAKNLAELQKAARDSLSAAKLEAEGEKAELEATIKATLSERDAMRTTHAEAIAENVAEIQRKNELIAMYQKREKPKETFGACVDELKARQAQRGAEEALEAARAELAAAQEREAATQRRCDELEASLDAAQRESAAAATRLQAKERELSCVLRLAAAPPAAAPTPAVPPAAAPPAPVGRNSGKVTLYSETFEHRDEGGEAGARQGPRLVARRASFAMQRRPEARGEEAAPASKVTRSSSFMRRKRLEPQAGEEAAASATVTRSSSFMRAPKRFRRSNSFSRVGEQ